MTTTDEGVPQDVTEEILGEFGWQERATQAETAVLQWQSEAVRAEARITELLARVERLNAENQTLRRDIEIIADNLLEEAINRDWCSDYGNFIDGVNTRTSQPWMKHCEHTYVVTFTVSVTATTRNSSDDLADEIRGQLEDLSLEENGSVDSVDVTLRGVNSE